MKTLKIYTLGHSTRTGEELVNLLRAFGIEALVDVRRFPGSRAHPEFGREALERLLTTAGIEYAWLEELGGRRKDLLGEASPNAGLQNAGFRAYADYMETEPFREGVERLCAMARQRPTAIMCAERLYWKCHRRLISDYLATVGVKVLHIEDFGKLHPHVLTPGAVIEGTGRLGYPILVGVPPSGGQN